MLSREGGQINGRHTTRVEALKRPPDPLPRLCSIAENQRRSVCVGDPRRQAPRPLATSSGTTDIATRQSAVSRLAAAERQHRAHHAAPASSRHDARWKSTDEIAASGETATAGEGGNTWRACTGRGAVSGPVVGATCVDASGGTVSDTAATTASGCSGTCGSGIELRPEVADHIPEIVEGPHRHAAEQRRDGCAIVAIDGIGGGHQFAVGGVVVKHTVAPVAAVAAVVGRRIGGADLVEGHTRAGIAEDLVVFPNGVAPDIHGIVGADALDEIGERAHIVLPEGAKANHVADLVGDRVADAHRRLEVGVDRHLPDVGQAIL